MPSTLVFTKPDAIEKRLVGKIIARFEESGFDLTQLRKARISQELVEQLYPDSREQLVGMGSKTLTAMREAGREKDLIKLFGSEEPYAIGRELNQFNKRYATSMEVIAIVLDGVGGAKKAREVIGATDPPKAAKGTIRGDWADDSILKANYERRACRNLVHGSDEGRAPVEVELFRKHFFV